MTKRFLLFVSALLTASFAWAEAVTITESAGQIESAYVKWQAVANAESYNVYYTGEGIADKKIDNQLIRNYGTYYRADALGLKSGSYTLKVVPVISGAEATGATTGALTVMAEDRTGFAFSNNHIPGSYKLDGTPKSGAVILYITQNTKNTVSLDVTGASANPCVGLQAILDGFKKGKDNRPLIIRLVGQITDLEVLTSGDIVLENSNNESGSITFEGVGNDATADGWGIRIKNAMNIEIRNLGLMNCNSSEGDNIGLQQNNQYVWIHHCDFFYGDAGSDSDQAKGDGALDCKKSTYVTFSYNHFWDSGKCNLLGLSEGTTEGYYITYHHNWYDHSDSRHPRVRYYSAHVYNNYYDGNAKYGVGSTLGSSVFVEANYFRNCKYPILTSMQGSDVFDESKNVNDYSDMPTFSKEDGGTVKAFNNFMTGQRRFVAYGDAGYTGSTTDFDAYVTTSRNTTIPATVVSSRGANTYNNFDTNTSVMYSYTPDSPEDAKAKVMAYAGRLNGDFSWTFNNTVDDALYDVNTELKAALINYTTQLVSVQGDSSAIGGSDGGTGGDGGAGGDGGTGGDGGAISGDVVHNFTESGKTSTYFNITGSLSTSKGTVTYGNLTLTQCLKMESSTVVSFTTTQEATLNMVFNNDFTGKVKLDGEVYNPTAGILTETLAAGTHEITKGDIANIYFMSLVFSITDVADANAIELRLYPNPVQSDLNISTDAVVEKVDVYSLTGNMVKTTIGNVQSLYMGDLPAGTFLVVVQTTEGIEKQIIIKQ